MNGRTDHVRSNWRSDERFSRDLLLGRDDHGIYIGNGSVIHYSGLVHGLWRGPVEAISLECFAQGHGIRLRRDPRCFGRCEVVERVRSRLGERRYRILTNNCWHFCAWVLRDECRNKQVECLRATPLYRAICTQCERTTDTIVQSRAPHLWWDC